MKHRILKAISLFVCTILIICGVGETAFALTKSENTDTNQGGEQNTTDNSETAENSPYSKDETVYVLTGADGSVQKVIVSDWLQNTTGSSTIYDKSELKNIENVKSDAEYSLEAEDGCIWDAQGEDIYYQGYTDKELPVDLHITYKLDGTTVTADEIAGKSGKVTIRFDYTNHLTETVDIDGNNETVYVPFAMLTGVLLDNDHFSNIVVTNGKSVNDGDRTAVVGVAFPGLQEDLAISKDLIQIPDYIEITADATEFTLGTTLTVATNDIFSDLDVSELNSLDQLDSTVSALTDAMNQLTSGATVLCEGLDTLLEKSNELVSGVDLLSAGSNRLATGAASVDTGADQLKSGVSKLSGGLSTISSNNDQLTNGAKQVFDTLLATASEQLTESGLTIPALTIENYNAVLGNLLTSLDKETVSEQILQKVTDKVEAQRDYIVAQVTQTVQQTITNQVSASVPSGTDESAINATVAAMMQSDETKAMIAQNVELQIQKAISDSMESAEVKETMQAAEIGYQSVSTLKTSIDSFASFYNGLYQYTASVAAAADGAKELETGVAALKSGTEALSSGAAELKNGILTIKESTPALVDGVQQLYNGALALSDGLVTFDEQAVQKLVDAVSTDVDSLAARIQLISEISKNYCSFTGIGDDTDGTVKFIYRTE